MMEVFSDEGPEIVVHGYKFEPVFNANAIQTGESSWKKTALRNRIMKVHWFHFGLTLTGKQSQCLLCQHFRDFLFSHDVRTKHEMLTYTQALIVHTQYFYHKVRISSSHIILGKIKTLILSSESIQDFSVIHYRLVKW